jgi:ABC-type amino acid transport substrate-binding protein
MSGGSGGGGQPHRGGHMLKRIGFASGTAFAMMASLLAGTTTVAAANPNQGVTSTTIKVGIPYIDLSSLASQGVKLTQGSWPDAYGALIANLNAHGGVDGRKIVAYYEPVNLANGTVGVDSACTSLTEDDSIFVAMSPYEPNCYLVNHDTPTLNATIEGSITGPSAANFTLTPPATAYDPLQLAVFNKLGDFKGKKVGVVGGVTADQSQVTADITTLKKLHVKVVQSAVNSAPAGDQSAIIAQDQIIINRFQSAGVDEVVAVASASSGWPAGLAETQATYNPPWVALDSSALSGTLSGGPSGQTPFLKTLTTSTGTVTSLEEFSEAAVQKCIGIIKKAYPTDEIATPSATSNSQDHSYVSAESACQNVAMFTAIAKAAGKNLTVASFTKAGYGLRNVTFPGSGGPVSFGPGQAYAIGPVFVGKYDAATNQLVFSTKSATS